MRGQGPWLVGEVWTGEGRIKSRSEGLGCMEEKDVKSGGIYISGTFGDLSLGWCVTWEGAVRQLC